MASFKPGECNDFGIGLVDVPVAGVNTNRFATEHILEFQLLTIFLESLNFGGDILANPTGGGGGGRKH